MNPAHCLVATMRAQVFFWNVDRPSPVATLDHVGTCPRDRVIAGRNNFVFEVDGHWLFMVASGWGTESTSYIRLTFFRFHLSQRQQLIGCSGFLRPGFAEEAPKMASSGVSMPSPNQQELEMSNSAAMHINPPHSDDLQYWLMQENQQTHSRT